MSYLRYSAIKIHHLFFTFEPDPVMPSFLIVLDELFPVRGAPQVRAHNLLSALSEWKRLGVGGQLVEGAEQKGFTLLSRPSERRPFRFLLFLFRLGRAALSVARREKPELSLLTVPKYEMLSIAPRLKRHTRTLIVDLRDSLDFLDYGAYLAHFLPRFVAAPLGEVCSAVNRGIHRRALAAADLVTVANEGIRKTIHHPRVYVVPNGVDTEAFLPEGKEWFSGGRSLRLVYLGNFAEKDRFEWLTALKGRSDVEIHLIGDGRNRGRVEERLSGVKTVFHGIVPHEELPRLLCTMDVGFIFRESGVDQSIPVCLFEFTSMNIPQICNNTGLMANFVREHNTGFVVESEEQFLATLNTLFAIPATLSSFHHLHALAEEKLSLRASREIFRAVLMQEGVLEGGELRHSHLAAWDAD